MNAACELCRGACCESLMMKLPDGAVGVWLRYHGEPIGADVVEIHSPCRMLRDGKCGIWENRPAHCSRYEVGGQACRTTVRHRRDNWREIFGAMNPTNAEIGNAPPTALKP